MTKNLSCKIVRYIGKFICEIVTLGVSICLALETVNIQCYVNVQRNTFNHYHIHNEVS